MPTTIIISPDDAGKRLDTLLSEKIPGLSRNAAQRLIDDGTVLLCGAKTKKNARVADGEQISVEIPQPSPCEAKAQDIGICVVYEDDDVIVVDKAKGMVVHPAAGHRDNTLVNALLSHCGGSLSGIGGKLRPGIIHRLDKDTSGLLVAAKNDRAHSFLSAELKERRVKRVYDAVVVGGFRDDGGTVDAPIGRHRTDRKRMAVTEKNSRSAVTHYEVVGRYEGYTRVKCILETGRTHQIRVHMAHIGHPVVGDRTYGPKKCAFRIDGQCLHAGCLSFVHPSTGRQMVFEAALPEYFKEILSRLSIL